MELARSLKYGVWYSIYSVVVKYSKVTVMVGQNRYFKMRILSHPHTQTEVCPSFFLIGKSNVDEGCI